MILNAVLSNVSTYSYYNITIYYTMIYVTPHFYDIISFFILILFFSNNIENSYGENETFFATLVEDIFVEEIEPERKSSISEPYKSELHAGYNYHPNSPISGFSQSYLVFNFKELPKEDIFTDMINHY